MYHNNDKFQESNPISLVLSKLQAKQTGDKKWQAICPVHEDDQASLSVGIGDDERVLLNCFAGCKIDSICEAIDIDLADLHVRHGNVRSATKKTEPAKQAIVYATASAAVEALETNLGKRSAHWIYYDKTDEPVGIVSRWNLPGNKKTIRQTSRRNDDWVNKGMIEPRPLYNLKALADAEVVVFCEGEKCVEEFKKYGFVATTSSQGANSAIYEKHDWSVLAGKAVVIFPDNHEPGFMCANNVARILTTKIDPPTTVKIATLPDIPDGGDIVDFVDAQREDCDIADLIVEVIAKAVDWVDEDELIEEEEKEKHERTSQSDVLVKLAISNVAEFWHDPDERAFATIPIASHFENYEIKTKPFRRWLAGLFFAAKEKAANSQAIQDALGVLEGMAIFKGRAYEVFTRYAAIEDRIYIDLADDDWRVIEVTRNGWTILGNSPIKFRRAAGMMPLPQPTTGGDLADLKHFINYGDADQLVLMVSWLVSCYMPNAAYPCLEIDGEQGSAKSTASWMLRQLIDPNKADLRSSPREERDLIIAAMNGHVLAFDNLSACSHWLSDALCRLSTGGGFSTRQLYENDAEFIFSGKRPIITNGIGGVANRSDLLDRTIRVSLPTITIRIDERKLKEDFDAARPALLGAILDATSMALKNIDDVQLENLPRMTGFAKWIHAAEPALPWESGEFIRAYRDNRINSNQAAIEASVIGPALIAYMSKVETGINYTATTLLNRLCEQVNGDSGIDQTRKLKGWPQSPAAFGKMLQRIAPDLRAIGYAIDLDRSGSSRRYFIERRKQ